MYKACLTFFLKEQFLRSSPFEGKISPTITSVADCLLSSPSECDDQCVVDCWESHNLKMVDSADLLQRTRKVWDLCHSNTEDTEQILKRCCIGRGIGTRLCTEHVHSYSQEKKGTRQTSQHSPMIRRSIVQKVIAECDKTYTQHPNLIGKQSLSLGKDPVGKDPERAHEEKNLHQESRFFWLMPTKRARIIVYTVLPLCSVVTLLSCALHVYILVLDGEVPRERIPCLRKRRNRTPRPNNGIGRLRNIEMPPLPSTYGETLIYSIRRPIQGQTQRQV